MLLPVCPVRGIPSLMPGSAEEELPDPGGPREAQWVQQRTPGLGRDFWK